MPMKADKLKRMDLIPSESKPPTNAGSVCLYLSRDLIADIDRAVQGILEREPLAKATRSSVARALIRQALRQRNGNG